MASNSEASTSKRVDRNKSKKSDGNFCGLLNSEYDAILAALDSEEEPFIDSGSEYMPNSDESDLSDCELDQYLLEETESPDNIESNIIIEAENVEDDITPENQGKNALNYTLALNWTNTPFTPSIHAFDNTNSGARLDSIENKTDALAYFLLFVNLEVAELIVSETNKYASNIFTTKELKWKPVDVSEFYVFLGLMLLTGRHGKNKLRDNWSTDALLHTPIFSQSMPRNRFQAILGMLHFSENADQKEGDSFHKLRAVFYKMTALFQERFYPFQNLAIDESLVLFKGRLRFKQYIKSKRHRFGIKLFLLCDCETGYVLNIMVYLGKATEMEQFQDLGLSGSVVATLMKPYLNKGHSLYTDNWYTSPNLSTYLHEQKTNSCGTVRVNRKGMPNLTQKLNKGETVSMASNHLLAVKWKDRRDVVMLTNMHEDHMVTLDKVDFKSKEPIKKPAPVVDYNANMGAIDRSDMMLSSTECARKTIKWYKKLFFHMVDLALLNAHALYLTQNTEKEALADFQLKVIRQIFEK